MISDCLPCLSTCLSIYVSFYPDVDRSIDLSNLSIVCPEPTAACESMQDLQLAGGQSYPVAEQAAVVGQGFAELTAVTRWTLTTAYTYDGQYPLFFLRFLRTASQCFCLTRSC